MTFHYTAPSASGVRLPTSGKIVGLLADALRLRVACRVRWKQSGKTLQRYFAGKPTRGMADDILRVLVDALVPDTLSDVAPIKLDDVRAGAFALAKTYTDDWDRFTAHLHAEHFPISEVRDLPIPPLRLAILDLGLRWGAWETIRTFDTSDNPNWSPALLQEHGVRVVLDVIRGERTIEGFAEEIDVSAEAVRGWRRGASYPSDTNIDRLAALVETPWTITHLRCAIGIAAAREQLGGLVGTDVIDDMVDALTETARRVHESHAELFEIRQRPEMWSPLAPIDAKASIEQARAAMVTVLLNGARSAPGKAICGWLAAHVAKQDLAADFASLSLPTDWTQRASYWTWRLGSLRRAVEFSLGAVSGGKATAADIDRFTEGLRGAILRMANFDEPSSVEVLSSVPAAGPVGQAMHLAGVAAQLSSIGRLHDAADTLREAVRLAPDIAVLHFKLGATLGTLASHGHPEHFDEALLECRVAVKLAPEEGNFRNEIGIILSNRRHHEEAEAAYAEAEPYFADHHHHWYARGNNYVALSRLEDARLAFTRGVGLSEPKPDIHCLRGLAACLMALAETVQPKAEAGKLRREARRVADRAVHLGADDPIIDWQDTLDIWRDQSR